MAKSSVNKPLTSSTQKGVFPSNLLSGPVSKCNEDVNITEESSAQDWTLDLYKSKPSPRTLSHVTKDDDINFSM